jgi:hypothetical protein
MPVLRTSDHSRAVTAFNSIRDGGASTMLRIESVSGIDLNSVAMTDQS